MNPYKRDQERDVNLMFRQKGCTRRRVPFRCGVHSHQSNTSGRVVEVEEKFPVQSINQQI